MARPSQFDRADEDLVPSFMEIKARVKRMAQEDRARLLAWLALYYDDQGSLYSQAQARKRDKATIAGQDYWLVRIPKK